MTDESIVDLYFSRSESAIAETERAYGRYLSAVARGILGSDADAEEIVNDTYLKAWNAIPPERPHTLKRFLAGITRQLSINRLEQRTAEKRGGGQYVLVLDELAECIPDRASDPIDRVALETALNAFLRSLSPEMRRVFIRRYYRLTPVARIAKDLAISESKVKSILMRARSKLKEQLIKEGFEV